MVRMLAVWNRRTCVLRPSTIDKFSSGIFHGRMRRFFSNTLQTGRTDFRVNDVRRPAQPCPEFTGYKEL